MHFIQQAIIFTPFTFHSFSICLSLYKIILYFTFMAQGLSSLNPSHLILLFFRFYQSLCFFWIDFERLHFLKIFISLPDRLHFAFFRRCFFFCYFFLLLFMFVISFLCFDINSFILFFFLHPVSDISHLVLQFHIPVFLEYV